MDQDKEPRDWEKTYEEEEVQNLPWYISNLDIDFEKALEKFKFTKGTVLDLGTGPATQAIALAKMGYQVMASDVSNAAISKALKLPEIKELGIVLQQDDILNSKINRSFDLIIDRGCFHTILPAKRADYISSIQKLLNKNGYLFLKCFSHLQPGDFGPYRFKPDEIEEIFSPHFFIHFIKDSEFDGGIKPKALFAVMQNNLYHLEKAGN